MQFVVIPDSPDVDVVAPGLSHLLGPDVLEHASGRPWLVGRWAAGDLDLVTCGARRLVVAGSRRTDTSRLERAVRAADVPSELDATLRQIPGSFHVSVSLPGGTGVRGCVSTAHQVFTCGLRGVTFAATDPAPLRDLTAAALDEAVIASQLLMPIGMPWPLSRRGIWQGIDQLDIGHWLVLDRRGRATTRRWWTPPPATESLEAAARTVRLALDEAVSVRAADGRTISADLSGGLDSTSICFVAAELGADLVTCHVTPLDEANEDGALARLAAGHLPGRHLILPAHRPESWFDAPLAHEDTATAIEGPPHWAEGRPHVKDVSQRVAALGSDCHLVGLGGDELFGLMPSYLWSLWRRRPLSSLTAINRRRLMNRWRVVDVARALIDRRGFASSVAAASDSLTGPAPGFGRLDTSWSGALRLPSWATSDAVAATRGLMRETAALGWPPLDDDRTRHQVLASVAFEGTTMRQLASMLQGSGVAWQAPLLDDRVIDAAFSVRVEDHSSPVRFKPLLAEAVGDIVPGVVLERRTKGEFSAEMYRGLDLNRARLLDLCEDSRLATLGLVDMTAVRAAILDPGPLADALGAVQRTVACESWLRSPNATPRPLRLLEESTYAVSRP